MIFNENPRVGSSILTLGTTTKKAFSDFHLKPFLFSPYFVQML